jgi:hypothetical protein
MAPSALMSAAMRPKIGLALAKRIGICALVGDDSAAGAGDDAHARDLALRDETVARVVIRHAAGAVFDAILDLKASEATGLEQVRQLNDPRLHAKPLGFENLLGQTLVDDARSCASLSTIVSRN